MGSYVIIFKIKINVSLMRTVTFNILSDYYGRHKLNKQNWFYMQDAASFLGWTTTTSLPHRNPHVGCNPGILLELLKPLENYICNFRYFRANSSGQWIRQSLHTPLSQWGSNLVHIKWWRFIYRITSPTLLATPSSNMPPSSWSTTWQRKM